MLSSLQKFSFSFPEFVAIFWEYKHEFCFSGNITIDALKKLYVKRNFGAYKLQEAIAEKMNDMLTLVI